MDGAIDQRQIASSVGVSALILACLQKSNPLSSWIDCQNFDRSACLGLEVVSSDVLRCADSETGLRSIMVAFDAELLGDNVIYPGFSSC